MTSSRTLFADPRRRNLAILAGVALVLALLAVWGVLRQAAETAPREQPASFFPGLQGGLRHLAQIRIASKKGTVDVVFKPARSWVVASHDDYPASFEQIHQTVVGMIGLTTLARKTARPDWLSYLGLGAPGHGGNGTEITLLDDKGGVIASLIAGKTTDIGDPSGAIGLFVRHPDNPQSWLARSVFEPKSDPGDWLNNEIMTIDHSRIAEADVDPISGPSYVVRRDKPSDPDFKLVDLPKGRELSYDSAPDTVGGAVVDFSFDDVAPARNFDFSDPTHTARVVTRTFDGLRVTVNVIRQGADYWATVSAEGTGPDARKEAWQIDAHTTGWAYKLPAFKGQQFMTPLENLLKPKGGAAAPGAPAH